MPTAAAAYEYCIPDCAGVGEESKANVSIGGGGGRNEYVSANNTFVPSCGKTIIHLSSAGYAKAQVFDLRFKVDSLIRFHVKAYVSSYLVNLGRT